MIIGSIAENGESRQKSRLVTAGEAIVASDSPCRRTALTRLLRVEQTSAHRVQIHRSGPAVSDFALNLAGKSEFS
jgi:hypothetical protein